MLLLSSSLTVQHKKDAAYVEITRSVFQSNVAPGFGGAITVTLQGRVTLIDVDFVDNKGSTGGALVVGSFVHDDVPSAVLTRGSFVDNEGRDGGGVCVNLNARMTIHGTRFSGNKVAGGVGGGIAVQNNAVVSISDCVFLRNTALGGHICPFI